MTTEEEIEAERRKRYKKAVEADKKTELSTEQKGAIAALIIFGIILGIIGIAVAAAGIASGGGIIGVAVGIGVVGIGIPALVKNNNRLSYFFKDRFIDKKKYERKKDVQPLSKLVEQKVSVKKNIGESGINVSKNTNVKPLPPTPQSTTVSPTSTPPSIKPGGGRNLPPTPGKK